jgi:hypothetical protein
MPSTGNQTLSAGQTAVLLAFVVGGALVAGLVVLLGRHVMSPKNPEQSIVRSWLAITLVFGLLVFCAASFEINSDQLRSVLLGGLVASTGAATAFYFSSKGADKARADILQATTTLAQGAAPPREFSAADPPAPTSGQPYEFKFVADGTPPLTYTLNGALPGGLTLDPDGTLKGTPTAGTNGVFTVIATNSLGSLSTKPITLQVP